MQLKHIKNIILLLSCFCCFCTPILAQNNDSMLIKKDRSFFGRLIHKGIKSISHKIDTTDKKAKYRAHIESYFQPYEGKIVRNITIREFGFDRSFSDTASSIKYFGTKILNKLHNNSSSWVIRNNLFIKKGDSLHAYLIADNERYLRALNFIRDARILVKMISPTSDSVDLLVITKDLFSLTGSIHHFSLDKQEISAGEENFMGWGQSITATLLHDKERNPAYGVAAQYKKYNAFNTFTNISFGYTDKGDNLYNRRDNEQGFYLNINRPLYSQYASLYGFLHLADAQSVERYTSQVPPNLDFYQYHYHMLDGAIGYNFGAKKDLKDNPISLKKVLSLRYYRYNFLSSPSQFLNRYVEKLNDRQAYLAQFTFFKQKFFKTRYILGFGTTEDIPYGYNISFTGGWYKIKDLSRPYIGIDANRYIYSNKGDIAQWFLRAGTYFNHGIQDANLLFGTSLYSRLIVWRRTKIRQFFRLSYTKQFNTYISEPLRISNAFGPQRFTQDSILGNRRITLRSETVFYTPGRLFGFSFAPFLTGDVTYLTPTAQSIDKTKFYYGVGGGIRTRNENLVFGTIELKAIYFPHKVSGLHQFKIGISTNLRFRYNSNYVSAPSMIQYNSDIRNDIF